MIEVNDRLARAAATATACGRTKSHAETINALVGTVERLAALVPDDKLDDELRDGIARARRYKVLEEIIDIDLADPALMAQSRARDRVGAIRRLSRLLGAPRSSAATMRATSSPG